MKATEEIIAAVKSGDEDRLIKLLSSEPSLINARTEKGESLVLLSVYHRRPEILGIILGRDYAMDVFEAAATGNVIRLGELINEEPELLNSYSPDGFTPLGLACFFGHLGVVQLLISLGANLNISSKNSFKVMPIHSSVAAANYEITRELLKNGANPNVRQQEDITPLHQAAIHGDEKILTLLLEYGADVFARMSNGKTAKDLATEKEHTEIIKLLL